MKKAAWYLVGISCSALIQFVLKIELSEQFITALLTVFSIFFGFYITSLSVYAGSKYMPVLYKITDEDDRTKTLLDTLLAEMKKTLYSLYFSIIYLIILYAIGLFEKSYVVYFACILWWVLFINFKFAYHVIERLIDVVLQTAKRAKSEDKK